MHSDFWEQDEQVERFAAREPDHRLVELVERYPHPRSVRVLDLGCAGGRNTEFLARRGFDVHAVDASQAMVRRTRERMGEVLGDEMARRRVHVAAMDDLSLFPDESFLIVVALGVHHNARSRAEHDRALAEAARVLAPGGLMLTSDFTPETDLTGEGVTPVPGEPGIFDGFSSGRYTLLDAAEHDAAMARVGLVPKEPSRTVEGKGLAVGRRVSVNGLYRKA